jgi:hypothetical protein
LNRACVPFGNILITINIFLFPGSTSFFGSTLIPKQDKSAADQAIFAESSIDVDLDYGRILFDLRRRSF